MKNIVLAFIVVTMLGGCGNRPVAYYQPAMVDNSLQNWQLQQIQMQQQQMQAQQIINNSQIQHQQAYQNLLRTMK